MSGSGKFALKAIEFNTALRVRFAHASANRSETQSVLVAAKPVDGEQKRKWIGLGESAPRDYVTGETVASVLAFFKRHKQKLEAGIASLADLKTWIEEHEDEIDNNPAAFAGMEGAILDFLAKQKGETIEQFLGLPQLRDRFRYSAVLSDSRPWKFWLQALLYWAFGFLDFKVKISGDLKRDRNKFRVFQILNTLSSIRLRADANNLWTDADTCIRFMSELETSFWAIEEPVTARQAGEQVQIANRLGVKIILDESAIIAGDLKALEGTADCFIANIRISKNGGIMRSLSIAEVAAKSGIPLIFGAHVGESSILTRYGLTVANAFQSHMLAQEGCFGRFLIKRDAVSPSLHFGFGGVFEPKKYLDGDVHGSGLEIEKQVLDRF